MIYAFDEYELDVDRAELRRAGEPVAVEPQVFELIKLLVSARERVVSRDEIFEVIWCNRIVSDAALSSRIRDARKALGDDGTTQRLIRTVQRRGLRFIGDAVERAAQPVNKPTPKAESRNSETDDVLKRPAVAVLPFETPSGEAGDQFLADGLTDEIAAALSAWRYFPVISRNSALRYRGSDLSGSDIGASLGARYLLTGAFRRAGNRIKVSVTLTDSDADQQIWTQRVTRDLDELIDLEEEIAAQVATLVAPELEGAEARRVIRKSASDLSAWELAMRAAWLIKKGSESDFVEAEKFASQSIERAPDWTLPYTLIAISRFQQAMKGFSGSDSKTAFSDTLVAAQQALEIDRSSWISHALTAVGELWTNHNHERALLHVNRAIELNPSAAMNYHFGGCITGFSGDPEGARQHQERLFRLDPLYPFTAVIEADLGLWHLLDKQFSQADDRLCRSHQWDPRYGRTLQRQIALAGLQDDTERANVAARKLSDLRQPLDHEVIAASYPFRNPDHNELFSEGLRRSGVSY